MRVRAFDFFRGVAILGVMFHHYVAGPFSEFVFSKCPDHAFLFIPLINSGWLGVTVFFVLSGAVLYNVNLSSSLGSVLEYYRHRSGRLIPLYFILIVATFIMNNDNARTLLSECFWLLSGFHNVVPSLWMPDMLWVCWSLGIEIMFSISLPAIIVLINKFGLTRTVVLCAVACWLYRLIADHAWFCTNSDYKNHLINPFLDNIFGRMDDFIIGMAAGFMIRKRKGISTYFVIISMIILIMSAYGWGIVIESKRDIVISVLVSTLHLSVSASVAVLLVAAARWSLFNKKYASPFVFMGTICYSAYFIHAFLMRHFVIFSTEYYWNSHKSLLGVLLISTAALFLTVVLSMITFVYIEASGIKHVPAWAFTFRDRVSRSVQAAISWRPSERVKF